MAAVTIDLDGGGEMGFVIEEGDDIRTERLLEEGDSSGGGIQQLCIRVDGCSWRGGSSSVDVDGCEVVVLTAAAEATVFTDLLFSQLIYSGYSCKQGWFFTPCTADPSLRGLKNILKLHVKKVNCSQWEQIPIPSSVRAIVALNLHNYGSGRHPWGSLKPEYMEKKGFVEAHADDGLLEVFGLKHGWHASFVMVELISAKHIAQAVSVRMEHCTVQQLLLASCYVQAAAIRFEFRGGDWKEAFMQMDGEPWKQPMNKEYSSFVEIKRMPFQSVMINGE
ncbi:hypothetical protein RJ640_030393 [Escallonia rubra]|uniref:Diacylglycerol kinase accessory domain-containing protein n=1 Tax=Escallonia rubra TaxID=112253 RepID=A0AA88UAC9_9ASTE|nr:hypothetical protein RJ640_030393 [Escallonia rubra]